jgi:hypothetical protein
LHKLSNLRDYQIHLAVAKTAKIPGKVADVTTCPHSKNKPMPLSEGKNVTISLLFSYKL